MDSVRGQSLRGRAVLDLGSQRSPSIGSAVTVYLGELQNLLACLLLPTDERNSSGPSQADPRSAADPLGRLEGALVETAVRLPSHKGPQNRGRVFAGSVDFSVLAIKGLVRATAHLGIYNAHPGGN